MKKITVLSKEKAKSWVSDEPWIAISVSTQEGEWPVLSEANRQGLLQIAFKDSEFRGREGISPNQAKSIVEFVASHSVDKILVHCEVGHSRSPAIAAAIANIFNNGEDREFFLEPFTPNRLVYDMVLRAADYVK